MLSCMTAFGKCVVSRRHPVLTHDVFRFRNGKTYSLCYRPRRDDFPAFTETRLDQGLFFPRSDRETTVLVAETATLIAFGSLRLFQRPRGQALVGTIAIKNPVLCL